jgi:chemotaxis protein CheD
MNVGVSENARMVAISEIVVSNDRDEVLVAYGLGSCVAVCLYDPVARVGGMLHALLPMATRESNGTVTAHHNSMPAKFVDLGVPLLLEAVLKAGAMRSRLVAYLCGGAHMLTAPGFQGVLNIGQRNVLAAEAALQAIGIKIRDRATGGNAGRTVKLHITTGQVTVRALGQGEQVLA